MVRALDASDPFWRVLSINDPLKLPDDTPLRRCLPEAWVTLGDLRSLLADWERRGEALLEMHALLPAVMDALESDADKGKRRAAFESIQEAYEPTHPWGAALEGGKP